MSDICPSCWLFGLSGPCTHIGKVNVRTADAPYRIIGTLEVPERFEKPGPLIVETFDENQPFATIELAEARTSHPAIFEICARSTQPLKFWQDVKGFQEAPNQGTGAHHRGSRDRGGSVAASVWTIAPPL